MYEGDGWFRMIAACSPHKLTRLPILNLRCRKSQSFSIATLNRPISDSFPLWCARLCIQCILLAVDSLDLQRMSNSVPPSLNPLSI